MYKQIKQNKKKNKTLPYNADIKSHLWNLIFILKLMYFHALLCINLPLNSKWWDISCAFPLPSMSKRFLIVCWMNRINIKMVHLIAITFPSATRLLTKWLKMFTNTRYKIALEFVVAFCLSICYIHEAGPIWYNKGVKLRIF